MQHPRDRIAHTMAFVIPVVEHWLEREIKNRCNLHAPLILRPVSLYKTSITAPEVEKVLIVCNLDVKSSSNELLKEIMAKRFFSLRQYEDI